MYETNEPSTQKNGGMVELNNAAPTENNRRQGVFFLLLSALCFSLMSLFVRLAGDLPTFQKAFFRNVIAAIVAFCLLAKSGNFKMHKGSLPALLARSVVGLIGIVGNFYAIDRMSISDASILNKLAPFFSVAFSGLILKEKASWKDWVLIAVAFLGAVVIIRPTYGIEQSIPALVGVLGGLGAGLAYTFVRYLSQRGERGIFIVFFFSAFSSVAILPLMVLEYQPMTGVQLCFLLLAGVAASGAQLCVTKAYSCAPAKDISVYDYSQVLFTALWGVLFLSPPQIPDFVSYIGYTIIIGAAVVKYMVSRKH